MRRPDRADDRCPPAPDQDRAAAASRRSSPRARARRDASVLRWRPIAGDLAGGPFTAVMRLIGHHRRQRDRGSRRRHDAVDKSPGRTIEPRVGRAPPRRCSPRPKRGRSAWRSHDRRLRCSSKSGGRPRAGEDGVEIEISLRSRSGVRHRAKEAEPIHAHVDLRYRTRCLYRAAAACTARPPRRRDRRRRPQSNRPGHDAERAEDGMRRAAGCPQGGAFYRRAAGRRHLERPALAARTVRVDLTTLMTPGGEVGRSRFRCSPIAR